VVAITLFSKTRVDPDTMDPSAVIVCTIDAFPGYIVAVPFAFGLAPEGVIKKPTRPAERCG
jgi:hypothetical protein